MIFFFFSSRRRHTRLVRDWSSDVCSSDLHDPETEKEVWIDTRSYQERLNYNRTMKERLEKLKKESERIKFDLITVSTTEDYVEPLMSFFKQREKRF